MTRRVFLLPCLLILLQMVWPGQAWAGWLDTLRADVHHAFCIGGALFTAPLSFRGPDFQRIAIGVGGTILLSTADRSVKKLALSHHNRFWNRVFSVDHIHGNVYSQVYGLLFYGAGLIFKKPSLRRTGLYAVEAFVYAGSVSSILKEVVGRRRPYAGESQYVFHPLSKKEAFRSFPSGHTTTAFAVSTALAEGMKSPVWRAFWWSAAVLVAGARIYHNAHWFSDVVPSAALGYVVGHWIRHYSRNGRCWNSKPSHWQISIVPEPVGIRVYWSR